jgi:DNA-directed RNA polymerase I, II, and III subunit RPABC2
MPKESKPKGSKKVSKKNTELVVETDVVVTESVVEADIDIREDIEEDIISEDVEDDEIVSEEDKSITAEESEGEEFDDKCIYRYAQGTLDEINDSDDEDIEEVYDDEDDKEQDLSSKIVPNDQRITKRYMTKYERNRLIGDRTKQLALGAKPLIKNVGHLAPKDVAKLELEHNIMPLVIERPLPNGMKERWKTSELEHKHLN